MYAGVREEREKRRIQIYLFMIFYKMYKLISKYAGTQYRNKINTNIK